MSENRSSRMFPNICLAPVFRAIPANSDQSPPRVARSHEAPSRKKLNSCFVKSRCSREYSQVVPVVFASPPCFSHLPPCCIPSNRLHSGLLTPPLACLQACHFHSHFSAVSSLSPR